MRNSYIKPTVSIIIPVKNEEKNINLCLDGISNLEYSSDKLEVIIVDNGSTDNTRKIARKRGVKVFEMNEGTIASLRNLGVEKSKGEFIGFIDADVIVDRYWLVNALQYFNDENVVCVGSSPDIPDNPTWVESARYLNVIARPDMAETKWITSMNMLIRKSVFKEVNGFSEGLITCEDVDLGYRIGNLKRGYKIIRDKRIRAIHIGEAKTLLQLLKKERWRATSNYAGVMYHGIILDELPSLIAPLFNSIVFIVVIIALIESKLILGVVLLGIMMIFPIIKTFKIIMGTKKYNKIFQVFVIQVVCLFARIIATYDNVLFFMGNLSKNIIKSKA